LPRRQKKKTSSNNDNGKELAGNGRRKNGSITRQWGNGEGSPMKIVDGEVEKEEKN
jgi:hypothetical protein